MSEKRQDDEVGKRTEGSEDKSEDVVERLESLLDEEKMGGGEAAQELLDVEVDQSGRPVVLPPVWMSDDKMEARFVALPALKAPEPAPSSADLDLEWP